MPDWRVDSAGNVVYKDQTYIISRGRLTESDWIAHLSLKSWFNLKTFLPVYVDALDRAGVSDEALGKLIRKAFLDPYGN